MKKMLVVALLAAGTLVACGGKNKGASTPANKDKTTDMKSGATGGAAYGGQGSAAAGSAAGANPCSPK